MKEVFFSAKNEAGRLIQRAKSLARNQGMYSHFSEERIIRKYLAQLSPKERFAVDIAAQDGRTMSNSYRLFLDGFAGIAFEYDATQFAKLSALYRKFDGVQLIRSRITPQNAPVFLQACGTPKEFAFLSLDIDSFDYFVLAEVLKEFRPRLICAEINECIPPPLRFTVLFDPAGHWSKDQFMGQSLSQLCDLAQKHRYDLVELHYNNAFLIPHEINPGVALEPSKAFKAGYVDQPDRKRKFPWNREWEPVLSMNPAQAKRFIDDKFRSYAGKYSLSVGGK
ncbi:MAG: hypothetical protein Q7R47_04705 [Candidatus Diapherotrites archaeon]|nr:hypothetical protein [Candidatus Diapherotrites archaeon]